MDFATVPEICLRLISSAIQRCRLSEELCRLSVILKCSRLSDPLVLRISISDTGVGSCLEEFRSLKFLRDGIGAEKWDGVLSVRTTSILDNEIYHHQLNLKGSSPARRLTRLRSSPKNGVKFSGTEVLLCTSESIEVLQPEIISFLQKILLLKIPNIAYEVLAELEDASGSRLKNLVLADGPFPQLLSSSNLERLKVGLEDYVLKHGNSSNKKCDSCFPTTEHLKVGSGIACCTEGHRNTGWMMEAVIVMGEISEPRSCCLKAFGAKSEVLYFKDFSPSSISSSAVKALKSIDWRSYGLNLASIVDQDGCALLLWEGLPPNAHIDIVLHCYHDLVMITSVERKIQLERNLTKRAVKLALDDMKETHAGVLLSAHALKIRSYAPDLAKTIAGLILSSNDSGFREECFSLLGLQFQEGGGETVEDCIEQRIISVVEMNDRKSDHGREEVESFLFKDACLQELESPEEEYEEDEDALSPLGT